MPDATLASAISPLLNAYSGDVDRVFRVMPITQTGHGDHQSGERWLDKKS